MKPLAVNGGGRSKIGGGRGLETSGCGFWPYSPEQPSFTGCVIKLHKAPVDSNWSPHSGGVSKTLLEHLTQEPRWKLPDELEHVRPCSSRPPPAKLGDSGESPSPSGSQSPQGSNGGRLDGRPFDFARLPSAAHRRAPRRNTPLGRPDTHPLRYLRLVAAVRRARSPGVPGRFRRLRPAGPFN